jgi:hypothetical protein
VNCGIYTLMAIVSTFRDPQIILELGRGSLLTLPDLPDDYLQDLRKSTFCFCALFGNRHDVTFKAKVQ